MMPVDFVFVDNSIVNDVILGRVVLHQSDEAMNLR